MSDTEETISFCILNLYRAKNVGAKHTKAKALFQGENRSREEDVVKDAWQEMVNRAWLIEHGKGTGREEHVSLNPHHLDEMFRHVREHVPRDDLERAANKLPEPQRRVVLDLDDEDTVDAVEAIREVEQVESPEYVTRAELSAVLSDYASWNAVDRRVKDLRGEIASLRDQDSSSGGEGGDGVPLDAVEGLRDRVEAVENQVRDIKTSLDQPDVEDRVDKLEEKLGTTMRGVKQALDRVDRIAEYIVRKRDARVEAPLGHECSAPRCTVEAAARVPVFEAHGTEWHRAQDTVYCEEHAPRVALSVGRENLSAARVLAKKAVERWQNAVILADSKSVGEKFNEVFQVTVERMGGELEVKHEMESEDL